jgi:hypothetical protein
MGPKIIMKSVWYLCFGRISPKPSEVAFIQKKYKRLYVYKINYGPIHAIAIY